MGASSRTPATGVGDFIDTTQSETSPDIVGRQLRVGQAGLDHPPGTPSTMCAIVGEPVDGRPAAQSLRRVLPASRRSRTTTRPVVSRRVVRVAPHQGRLDFVSQWRGSPAATRTKTAGTSRRRPDRSQGGNFNGPPEFLSPSSRCGTADNDATPHPHLPPARGSVGRGGVGLRRPRRAQDPQAGSRPTTAESGQTHRLRSDKARCGPVPGTTVHAASIVWLDGAPWARFAPVRRSVPTKRRSAYETALRLRVLPSTGRCG